MKYPQMPEVFKNEYEQQAWMYLSLGSAYSIISQYVEDDQKRENERISKIFEETRAEKRAEKE